MGVLEFISAIVGALVGGLGGFFGGLLYFKQTKKSKEIDNESKLAAEWEKLYREQKAITDKNSEKIGYLTERVNLLTIRVEKSEPFICTNTSCQQRLNYFIKNNENEKQQN